MMTIAQKMFTSVMHLTIGLIIMTILYASSLTLMAQSVHAATVTSSAIKTPTVNGGETRILLTGAAGFIGYHLMDHLATTSPKTKVIGIDNFNDYYSVELKYMRANDLRRKHNATIIEGDTCDEQLIDDLFRKYRFTHIVHLAAQAGVRYSLKNPKSYVTANIMCNVNLLEAIKKWNLGTRYIYASSSSVYGLNKIPFSESQTVDRPTNVYGSTKIAGEHLASVYNYLYGIQVIGLRFFTVYGDDGRPDMAVFGWAESMAHNRPITLYFKEGAEITRDFTHVDDIVRGIEGVIHYSSKPIRSPSSPEQEGTIENKPEVFNLGNNQPESVHALVSYLAQDMGKREAAVAKTMVPLPDSDMISTFADIDKASKLLGFKPRVSLQQGVRRFVQWYKSVFWPEDVIFTTYFTEKEHPERANIIKCSSFDLMSEWYESVHKLNLRAVVFHDALDDDFVAKYTTHNVRFVKVTLGERSNNDERFFIYLNYLKEKMKINPELAPKRVLMTDLFDVKFNRNPFDFMVSHEAKTGSRDSLFIGSERETIMESAWAQKRLSQCVDPKRWEKMMNSILLNPGIVGGRTSTIINFLSVYTNEMSKAPVSANCNTPVFNVIVRENPTWNSAAVTGAPFHTELKAYDNSPHFYIKHK